MEQPVTVTFTPEEVRAIIQADKLAPSNSTTMSVAYRTAIRKLHQRNIDVNPLERKI